MLTVNEAAENQLERLPPLRRLGNGTMQVLTTSRGKSKPGISERLDWQLRDRVETPLNDEAATKSHELNPGITALLTTSLLLILNQQTLTYCRSNISSNPEFNRVFRARLAFSCVSWSLLFRPAFMIALAAPFCRKNFLY